MALVSRLSLICLIAGTLSPSAPVLRDKMYGKVIGRSDGVFFGDRHTFGPDILFGSLVQCHLQSRRHRIVVPHEFISFLSENVGLGS